MEDKNHNNMKFTRRMSKLGSVASFDVLVKANALQESGRDIIHMEIGEPDFNTPENIKQAGINAIKNNYSHYSPAAGFTELRKVIAEYESKYKNIDIDYENIVVTSGAKPIMYYGITLFSQQNDEIIYPNPGYPVYRSIIRFTNATPIALPLLEKNHFSFDRDYLKSIISPKTKMIIINTPSNPTGTIFSKKDIEFIAELALKNNLMVLSDEIYSRIVYDKKFFSIYSIPEMKERAIILNGLSKTYAMTGWRLGWGIMNKDAAKLMIKLNSNITSCASTISQIAAIEALTGGQKVIEEMLMKFKERRDYIVKRINKIKYMNVVKPDGAFYVFPNIKETGWKSKDVADYLLDKAGVAVLPGTAFGKFGEGYLRISYATSMENIKMAMDRIELAMSKLKSKRGKQYKKYIEQGEKEFITFYTY